MSLSGRHRRVGHEAAGRIERHGRLCPWSAALRTAALGTLLVSFAPAAWAGVDMDELDLEAEGIAALSRAELDRYRGGFSFGPYMLNLGIEIITTVNDAITVQTLLTVDADALGAQLSSSVTGTGADAGAYLSAIDITELANGATYVLDGTTITHQIQNGITAAVQNSAEGVTIDQTVQMTVGVENYHEVMAGAGAAQQAAIFGEEIARFGTALGP